MGTWYVTTEYIVCINPFCAKLFARSKNMYLQHVIDAYWYGEDSWDLSMKYRDQFTWIVDSMATDTLTSYVTKV